MSKDPQYLQHVLDEIPVLVWVSDVTKLCIMFNRHWLEFTGRTFEQEYGTGWAQGVYPDDFARCLETYERAFDERQSFQMEYRLRHHSGEFRWVSDHGQPRHSESGEFIGYFGTCVDLTVQRAVESENVRLRDEIDQAKRVDSLGHLAATLAHEFNNVLMGIQPFTELLKFDGLAEHRRLAALDHIEKAVTRGKRVTADVLRFTRPAVSELQPFDVAAWLVDSRERMRPLAGAVHLDVIVPSEAVIVMGDREQIEQALSNLITNARDAIRDPHTGLITVEIIAFDDEVALAVRDNGAGIPADVLPRIFEPLFTTKPSGTGLGLPVVRAIAERHGHEVTIQTGDGTGTTISMGLSRVPSFQTDRMNLIRTEREPLNVLLVEDEESIALGIELLLVDYGISVDTATTGTDALAAIDSKRYDAVILDLGLPDMEGAAVLADARYRWPDLPFVISTGDSSISQDAEVPRGHTLVEHLIKPYELSQLLEVLERLTARTLDGTAAGRSCAEANPSDTK